MIITELMAKLDVSRADATGFFKILHKIGALPDPAKKWVTENQRRPNNDYDLSKLHEFDFKEWVSTINPQEVNNEQEKFEESMEQLPQENSQDEYDEEYDEYLDMMIERFENQEMEYVND